MSERTDNTATRHRLTAGRRWLAAAVMAGIAVAMAPISARAQSSAEIATTMQQLERQASRAGDLDCLLNGSIGKV